MNKVITSDKVEILIDKNFIKNSNLLKNLVEDLSNLDEVIPLENINSKILKLIIKINKEGKLEELLDIKIGEREQFILLKELAIAINYLDMPELLQQISKEIANFFKTRSSDQLIKIFEINYD